MSDVQVHVTTSGGTVAAGTLFSHRRRGVESATFSYTADYLAASYAYAIDPELPLVSGARQTVGAARCSRAGKQP